MRGADDARFAQPIAPYASSSVIRLSLLNSLDVVAGVGDPGSSTTLHTYDYTLRASGHRAGYTENATRFANAATRSYQYDDLYRLTGETIVAGVADPGLSGTVTYDLDKVGNRLNRTSGIANVSTRTDTYNNRDLLDSEKTKDDMGALSGATKSPELTML